MNKIVNRKESVISKFILSIENVLNKKASKLSRKSKTDLPVPLLTHLTAFIANVNINYFDKIKNSYSQKNLNSSKNDADHLVRTKVKLFELCVSLVYLILLFLSEYDNYTGEDYKFQDMIKKVFHSVNASDLNIINLNEVTDTETFWNYAYHTLLPRIENNRSSAKSIYRHPGNTVIGIPSLIQRRVDNFSCIATFAFKNGSHECYGSLDNETAELTRNFMDAYVNISSNETHNEGFMFKKWSSCGKGLFNYIVGSDSNYCGYTITLNKTLNEQLKILKAYQPNWIDHRTRLVTFRTILLNKNTSLYCLVKIIFNFQAFGYTDAKLFATTLHKIHLIEKIPIFILFALILFYYTFEEFFLIRHHGIKGISNTFFIVPGLIYFIFLIYYAILLINISRKLYDDKTTLNGEDVEEFSFLLSFKQNILDFFWGLSVHGSFYCLYSNYFGFNVITTYFCVFSSQSFLDRLCYICIFIILYASMAFPFYFVYGSHLSRYKTIVMSFSTLFRIILGDVYYKELENIDQTVTTIFFIAYVIMIFFIYVNINLAIVNFHYNYVSEKYKQDVDIDIGHLLSNTFEKMKNACRKRNKAQEDLESDSDNSEKNSVCEQPDSFTLSSLETDSNKYKVSSSLLPLQFSNQEREYSLVSRRSSVAIDHSESANEKDLFELVRKDFLKFNETQTISSKLKISNELNVFCTRNELIIYFRTHLFASNLKIQELFVKFNSEKRNMFHFTIINDILKYYLENEIVSNAEDLELLRFRLQKYQNSEQEKLIQVVDQTEKKVKSEESFENSMNFDEIYVNLSEFAILKEELEKINLDCGVLYEELDNVLKSFTL